MLTFSDSTKRPEELHCFTVSNFTTMRKSAGVHSYLEIAVYRIVSRDLSPLLPRAPLNLMSRQFNILDSLQNYCLISRLGIFVSLSMCIFGICPLDLSCSIQYACTVAPYRTVPYLGDVIKSCCTSVRYLRV